jgi:hypothetical protein
MSSRVGDGAWSCRWPFRGAIHHRPRRGSCELISVVGSTPMVSNPPWAGFVEQIAATRQSRSRSLPQHPEWCRKGSRAAPPSGPVKVVCAAGDAAAARSAVSDAGRSAPAAELPVEDLDVEALIQSG